MPNWAYINGNIEFEKELSENDILTIEEGIGSMEKKVDFNLIMPSPRLTTKCNSHPDNLKLIRHWYYNFGKLATEEQIDDALNGMLTIDGKLFHVDSLYKEGIHSFVLLDLLSATPDDDYVEEVNDWYQWQNKNWGTKWNSSESYLLFPDGYRMNVGFNTAWGINEELIYKLIEKIDSIKKIVSASFSIREESKFFAYDIEAYRDEETGELSFCFADVLNDITKDVEVECPICKDKSTQEIDIEDEVYYIYCDECGADFEIAYDNGKILY